MLIASVENKGRNLKMKLLSVLCSLTVLAGLSLPDADACPSRSYSYSAPVYHETYVQTPIAQAAVILVPAYQLQYVLTPSIGTYNAAQFVAQQPVYVAPVQQVQAAPQSNCGCFSQWKPGQQVRLQPQQQAPPAQQPLDDLPTISLDDSPPTGGVQTGPIATVLDEHRGAVAVLRQHCASCHSGKGKGDVSFFDLSGQLALTVDKADVLRAVERKADGLPRMPPTARSDPSRLLSDAEVQILRQWSQGQLAKR
jgi:mono/diheme cytochrome c family protein